MFEQAKLVLYGQVNERRMWGLVLVALSILSSAPVAYVLLERWVGWMQYPVAVLGFMVTLIVAAQVWGTVLTQVRNRWFA